MFGSGVDLKRFKFSPTKNNSKLNFLLSSRMIAEKGIYYYLDAATYFKEKYKEKIEFYLLGFIDTKNSSSIKIEELEKLNNMKIINYLGGSDKVEEIIKDMDCIILPSYYSEGIPKTLLEAAAMGKPIITTDNTGCRDAVKDKFNGYLIQPKSLDSLINAIEKFINLSDDERSLMGINSRKKAEKYFDENIIIDKYLRTINEYFR
ncbi:glycosyltransferase [Pelagibacteraceae bacterium]|nr:glycosyltransferase [Pelagibacteraceae bacterium]